MRKVLILTYYWPPAGGPGVQRVLKFSKYLPEYGWQPIILTVKNGEYPAIDRSLEKDIPAECIVYKVKSVEPTGFYKKMTGMKKEDKIPVAALSDKSDKLSKRLAHWIRLNVFIPDAKVGLIPVLVKKTRQILKEHKIDVLFATSPPHSIQLAAKRISKTFGLPWICDLRDPWTDLYHYDKTKRFVASDKINHALEKSVITRAGKLITVSPYFTRRFNEKGRRDDVIFIPNGFDHDDLAIEFKDQMKEYKDKFLISYVGNMSSNQNVDVFWQVIKDYSDTNPAFREKLQICIVGDVQPKIRQSISEKGIEDFVEYKGYLPHDEAIKFTRLSNVLLFIIGRSKHNKGVLTGKIFEYLSTKNPILSIGPADGDAAKIISEVNKVNMCDYDDYDTLYRNLSSMFEAWQKNDLDRYRSSDEVMKYTRQNLTAQLVKEFNKTAG